jgi:hypothetical protein
MTVLDVPFMSFPTFSKIEKGSFHQMTEDTQLAALKQNGEEEVALARELGQVETVNGKEYVWTEVYGDGQWAKRSYNNAGTSLSGSAVLIGKLCGKPLFVGVRNSFCFICCIHAKSDPKPQHTCFKNWDKGASAMEASIMLEGFKQSMEFHGLVYKTLIGDGDSSAFFNIKYVYDKPEMGNLLVEKIECKNHAVRRMNVNLAALLRQKSIPSYQKKHLKNRSSLIGKYAVYAIEHNRLRQPNTSSATLQKDILNTLYHCFGQHTGCSQYMCENTTLIVPETLKRFYLSLMHKPQPIKQNVVSILQNTTLWNQMSPIIKRLADLSSSLLHGATTNIAESFQSQVAKFIRGKRVNYSGRGGFNRRVACATLAFRKGPAYYNKQYRLNFGKSPSSHWKKVERFEDKRKESREKLGKKRKIRNLQKVVQMSLSSVSEEHCSVIRIMEVMQTHLP